MAKKRTGEPRVASAAGAARAARPKRTRKAAAKPPAADTLPETLAAMSAASGYAPGEREEIQRLAYSYWEERGRHRGSAEEDWFRAEAEVRRRRAQQS